MKISASIELEIEGEISGSSSPAACHGNGVWSPPESDVERTITALHVLSDKAGVPYQWSLDGALLKVFFRSWPNLEAICQKELDKAPLPDR